MARITKCESEARWQEILNVTAKLYQQMSFYDLNLKMIGEQLSFTRTAIYTYFDNKEEILLGLLEREYQQWNQDLTDLLNQVPLEKEQFTSEIAQSLARRPLLLKILAVDMSSLDEKSRPQALIRLKTVYGKSIQLIQSLLKDNFPQLSSTEIDRVVFAFFPFLYGVYPYTIVSDKQRQAMDQADVPYVYWSAEEMINNCLLMLLK